MFLTQVVITLGSLMIPARCSGNFVQVSAIKVCVNANRTFNCLVAIKMLSFRGKVYFRVLKPCKAVSPLRMIGEHLNAVKFISTRSINNKNFTIFCSINLDNNCFVVRNLRRAKKPMKINFPSNKVCGIIHSTQPFVCERISK